MTQNKFLYDTLHDFPNRLKYDIECNSLQMHLCLGGWLSLPASTCYSEASFFCISIIVIKDCFIQNN